MTLNRVKLGCAVMFMKYLAGAVFLIYLTKFLIWNKITFRLSIFSKNDFPIVVQKSDLYL